MLVTPGPMSSTTPPPSWPSRWGRNLSGPFAPSISLSCAPQMPVWWICTSTWPHSSGGTSIWSNTSGERSVSRMAAFIFIGGLRSLEVDEFVVAGVAEVAVEPDPLGGVEERFAGERPALHVE